MPQPENTEEVRLGLGDRSSLVFLVGDITRESCDAIVNAANSSLLGGGGVDGAIHRAGGPAILEECKIIVQRIRRLPAGEAVITTAGKMPCRRVIHTVGPIWYGGDRNEAETLANCYRNSLRLAAKENLTSIAFPAISTGAFGYPVDKAADVAVRAVANELSKLNNIIEIRFVLFDARTHKHYVNAAHEVLGRARAQS
ncbi:MAG: O-acetyl-ADP-ribose deacetylase [Terriglobales bacterium]